MTQSGHEPSRADAAHSMVVFSMPDVEKVEILPGATAYIGRAPLLAHQNAPQALIRRLASSRRGLGRTSAGSLFLGHCPALVLHFASIETHSRPFVRGMGTSVNYRYMLSVMCGKRTSTRQLPIRATFKRWCADHRVARSQT